MCLILALSCTFPLETQKKPDVPFLQVHPKLNHHMPYIYICIYVCIYVYVYHYVYHHNYIYLLMFYSHFERKKLKNLRSGPFTCGQA